MLVETARYWLDRVDVRHADDHPSLLGVMGPDEYTMLSSNNAYTNRMVAFALTLAAEHSAAAGADSGEAEEYLAVASGLPIPRKDDLVLQCEEFPQLADPRFDEFWPDRKGLFAGTVPQERMYRTKALKQADVLMLMMLFPDEFSDAEVRRAWEYYVPFTTHDSSLSPGTHAIIACRLGLLDEAVRFWKMAADIDLDIESGGAEQGVHIANAAANWMIAVFGFAGIRTAMSAQELTLNPKLPPTWSRLAFPIVWKGQRLRLDIRPDSVAVENRSRTDIYVTVNGQRRLVRPRPAPDTIWQTQQVRK